MNFFTDDTRRSVTLCVRTPISPATPVCAGSARLAGSEEALAHALPANQHPPVLRTHDRYGNRIDEVEFHPSWHWLMERRSASGCRPRRGRATARRRT